MGKIVSVIVYRVLVNHLCILYHGLIIYIDLLCNKAKYKLTGKKS